MITITYKDGAVLVGTPDGKVVYKDPTELKALIEQLQQAKELLVEYHARISEESHAPLWESV